MKQIIIIFVLGMLISMLSTSCNKQDESVDRLKQFAQEINNAPDKELSNGTVLTGCEYSEGDSLFTYIIEVSDNRYDKIDTDSIKRNFTKTVKSGGMSKIVRLLNKANVGLEYRLSLPEKEVPIEFSSSEISNIDAIQEK